MEKIPPNNFWTLVEDPRSPERQTNLFKMRQDERQRQKERQIIWGQRPILGRESWRRGSFHTIGNPLTGKVSGELWNLRGQRNQKINKSPQNSCWTLITSRELAHTLTSAHRKWGMGVRAQTASVLRVRNRIECSEGTNVTKQFKPWENQRDKQRTFTTGRL